jgi:3-hydroxy-3-methylglutaryl CoA synthase
MWVGANTPGVIKYYFGTEMEPDFIITPNKETELTKEDCLAQLECYVKHNDDYASKIMKNTIEIFKRGKY